MIAGFTLQPQRMRINLRQNRGWLAACLLSTILVLIPVAALFVIALQPGDGTWPHLAGYVLPRAMITTLALMAIVAALTASIGMGAAWLTATCEFPGRRLLEVALVLPLAIPTYIAAFAYIEFLDFTGPLQSAIRAIGGFESARDYWSPDIGTLPGAGFVLSVILYPYVYLTCRALLLLRSSTAIQVARTLGAGPVRTFLTVAVPLARPAIAVGVTLCLMETINDIGAMEFFGVQTLTFAVYDTWLNRGSLTGAAQLACVMLAVVVLLIAAERLARGHRRFHGASAKDNQPGRYRLSGFRATAAVVGCLLPPLAGFGLPAFVLVRFAMRRPDQFLSDPVLSAVLHSTLIAGSTAVVAVGFGLLLVYGLRITGHPLIAAFGRLASAGYAVPGTVLAVGVLIPFAAFDNWADSWMRSLFGLSTGLILTGSGLAIVYACAVRFLAMPIGTLDAGFSKISTHLDMAARTLGRRPWPMFGAVHLPLIRPALMTAGLMVFVDTLKELSATILLRPFNFDTLATLTYSHASRAAYGEAAVPALVIVLVGLVPVVLVLRTGATRPIARRVPEL